MRQKRQAEAGQHLAITGAELWARDVQMMIATMLAIGIWVYVASSMAAPIAAPAKPYVDPDLERILRAACTLPDVNGALTVFAKLDGKMTCWRMR